MLWLLTVTSSSLFKASCLVHLSYWGRGFTLQQYCKAWQAIIMFGNKQSLKFFSNHVMIWESSQIEIVKLPQVYIEIWLLLNINTKNSVSLYVHYSSIFDTCCSPWTCQTTHSPSRKFSYSSIKTSYFVWQDNVCNIGQAYEDKYNQKMTSLFTRNVTDHRLYQHHWRNSTI